MDTRGILGDDTILKGLSFSQVGDGEVVLCDGGIVALEPAVVIPLIRAVDFSLYHITNDLAAAIVEWHSPTQRHRGAGDVSHLRFTRRI